MRGYEFVIATSDEEREEAFRLRYSVFVKEIGAFQPASLETEQDAFDGLSAHCLARMDGQLVGAARVLMKTPSIDTGLTGEVYYDCTPFERDGVAVAEVSRSCVLPEHRGSKVLANLWKLAYMYAWKRGCTHFLTMAQVGSTDSVKDARLVYALLGEKKKLHPRYDLLPLREDAEPAVPAYPLFSAAERDHPKDVRLPPVMRLFHRFGLRACGLPVFMPSIGRVGMAMLADPETFSKETLEFFTSPDPSHRLDAGER